MDYLNFDVDELNLDQYIDYNLDSVIYKFRIRYNPRSGWQLSIYDPEVFDPRVVNNRAAKLYGERKMMPFQNILKNSVSPYIPQGYLALIDTEFTNFQNYIPPTYDNIGSDQRFVLVYSSKSEMEALGLEDWI